MDRYFYSTCSNELNFRHLDNSEKIFTFCFELLVLVLGVQAYWHIYIYIYRYIQAYHLSLSHISLFFAMAFQCFHHHHMSVGVDGSVCSDCGICDVNEVLLFSCCVSGISVGGSLQQSGGYRVSITGPGRCRSLVPGT